MSDELKACPFCGGIAELRSFESSFVICGKCAARSGSNYHEYSSTHEKLSIEQWNTRTPDWQARALEAEKKLQKLVRLIDFAGDENESMTEQEVACSASFKEALAHQNAEMLEEQVDQLQSDLTAAKQEVLQLRSQANAEAEELDQQLAAANAAIAVKDEAFGQSTPYPLADTLLQLAVAVEHLYKDHDCDAHGHEGFKRIAELARSYSNKITAALSTTPEAAKELLRDKERLDWLDKNRTNHIYEHFKFNQSLAATQKTWRKAIDAAIDAAMEKENKT